MSFSKAPLASLSSSRAVQTHLIYCSRKEDIDTSSSLTNSDEEITLLWPPKIKNRKNFCPTLRNGWAANPPFESEYEKLMRSPMVQPIVARLILGIIFILWILRKKHYLGLWRCFGEELNRVVWWGRIGMFGKTSSSR